MNFLKKLYYRSFQGVLKLVKPVLPYKDPIVLDQNEELGPFIKKLGVNRVLLLTDENLREIGLPNKLIDLLQQSDIKTYVFSGIKSNPTIANVKEAYKIYQKINPEAIIALGGGSVIDCAKATGIKAIKPKSNLSDLRGILKVRKKLPFIIAIPTTAGTGSETTLSAVLVDEKNQDKFAINDFNLQPKLAVLDSANTRSAPKKIRAITGMDALTHAIEAYIGNSLDKKSKASAIEAARLIFNNLEENYVNNSETSGAQLLFASFLAGRAFSRSYVGYIHALAHALGGFYDTPHGLANAILMPYVLESYRPKVDQKLYELSIFTGICSPSVPVEDAAEFFIDKIKVLNKKLNIPDYLEEIQVKDITKLAKHAAKEANPLYPVPVIFDEIELGNILKKAMKNQ